LALRKSALTAVVGVFCPGEGAFAAVAIITRTSGRGFKKLTLPGRKVEGKSNRVEV
jgi:hypothetical protein